MALGALVVCAEVFTLRIRGVGEKGTMCAAEGVDEKFEIPLKYNVDYITRLSLTPALSLGNERG